MRYGAGILPVCPPTGRALVLLRSEEVNHPLTWAGAGGGDEPADGNDPLATAAREFIEETGEAPSIYIAPIASVFEPYPFFLFVSIESEEFKPVLNFENKRAAWFDFDELMKLSPKHPTFEAMCANETMQFVLHQMLTTIPGEAL
jgi:8-oxo-dGTP pyrophosphatase MutT (NUDIX family)